MTTRPSVVVVSASAQTRFRLVEVIEPGRVAVTHLRTLLQLERLLRVHQPGTVVIDGQLLRGSARARPLARSLASGPKVLVLHAESPRARLPWPSLSIDEVSEELAHTA